MALMISKTFKSGNCIGVSLPREALAYLGILEGAEVSVELDRERRQIVIVPIDASLAIAGVDNEFAHEVKEFIEQYRPTLEALARK
jgi:antitoxin component of MazEF toxin-antitoxin module